MPLKAWFALFVLCISGCKNGPAVTVCVIDPERLGLQCVRPDETAYFLPLVDADNFACFSPRDLERILKACRSVPQSQDATPDEEASEPKEEPEGVRV